MKKWATLFSRRLFGRKVIFYTDTKTRVAVVVTMWAIGVIFMLILLTFVSI